MCTRTRNQKKTATTYCIGFARFLFFFFSLQILLGCSFLGGVDISDVDAKAKNTATSIDGVCVAGG